MQSTLISCKIFYTFVSQKSRENGNVKPFSSSSDEDENESNEPDYNEDQDQLEQKQEDKTTNKVF
jgi:hypothetical protein